MLPAVLGETRSDHHVASGAAQCLHDARNIARVVLAVTVNAHDEVVAEFERELVTCLHTPPETEMVWQGKHVGASRSGCVLGPILGAIVYHEYRHVRQHLA